MTRSSPRLPLIALGALLLLGGAGFGLSRLLSDEQAPEFELATVSRGAISSRVTASGTLSPREQVEVGSQVSGRITELLVDFNSPVQKGQILARLDTEGLSAELARASANLAAARANVAAAQVALEQAEADWARAQQLSAAAALSPAEVEAADRAKRRAEAELAAARAAVAQASASEDTARSNLANATITSPIDGVVITRAVEVGQTVAASLSAPTLFTLAGDLARMEIHTNVSESDVGRIQEGMPVEFSVDAWPIDRFSGAVREVRFSPQTVQNVVTYDAVVTVENPALKLRPGMTAEVTFVVEQRDEALLVPSAALRFKPSGQAAASTAVAGREAGGGRGGGGRGGGGRGGGGRGGQGGDPSSRVLFRLDAAGQPESVSVTVGISDGRNTEIREGLSEGDAVIVGQSGAEADGGEPKRPTYGRLL